MATTEVRVPNIGDFKDVDVIELLVKPGDKIQLEQSLLSVESEKATMEIPAPSGGTVREVKVKVGDKVSEGSVILTIDADEAGGSAAVDKSTPSSAPAPSSDQSAPAPSEQKAAAPETPAKPAGQSTVAAPAPDPVPFEPKTDNPLFKPHASPSVRLFARELGVDLSKVKGTGPKGRIQRVDVQGFVKGALHGAPAQSAAAPSPAGMPFGLPAWPQVDFAKFGPVEIEPRSRIKKLSAANLHRNWISIPHVTQFDEADITELEAFRKSSAPESEKQGFKLTLLSFLVKACVTVLREHPHFNASLDATGENLVVKKHYHIGVAVDTPEGLVVPVLHDADRKGVFELARELAELSSLARAKKLKPGDMQGGTFSISSLGGIGGTGFTPIINAPEVAILGVSKSSMRPVWKADTGQFVPRLMLPFSLAYDHRVIDGAAAARFTSTLASVLSDIRRSLL